MSEYRTVEERVATGAALLDAVKPEWVDLINLDDLDLSEPGYCVLAHVFGGYGTGLDILDGPLPDESTVDDYRRRDQWAVDHGFEVHPIAPTAHRAYDRLQREWQGLIEDRRAASPQLTAQ